MGEGGGESSIEKEERERARKIMKKSNKRNYAFILLVVWKLAR